MEQRHCEFWLPSKRRFCANSPMPDCSFCGNHNPSSQGERVPCPVDPSHSVFKRNVDSHARRCPLRKQAGDLESQPFYSKGINSGSGGGGSTGTPLVSSEEKRRAIFGLTVAEFRSLVRRIKSARASISTDILDSHSVPEACGAWMQQMRARQLPFQEKHALQQASILGNMERLGILDQRAGETDRPAVVEFGAGRGYLTHMLADCYGTRKVVLVERRSYKLKADRSLRQNSNMTIERLRINIEDLNLTAVENMKGNPYLAIGKHVCGPATDLTLRCCFPRHHGESGSNISNFLKGLAVATCCHHLCQWDHYINKKFLVDVGLNVDDFHAITWFSSWAVDADHSSDLMISSKHDATQKIEVTQTEVEDTSVKVGDDIGSVIRNMEAMERALFGFLCKEIIDIGRLMWLKEQGLDAHLVKYVPYVVSPENYLLVARNPTC